MATEAKLKVNISADGSQVKTEVQGVARAVQDAAGRMASAYASVSVQIKSVSAAVSGFQKALGIWNQVAVAIDATVKIIQKGLDVIRNFGKASEEAAESAAKFAERANGTGLDVSLYDAIAATAKTAGVEADEFSKKLRQFKEHKITFDELASSIGTTGDALLDAADAADASTVGRRYLARRKGEADEAKARAEQEKAEREGLREIAAQIVKKGDAFGRGEAAAPYWRMLMEAAGGDIGRAGEEKLAAAEEARAEAAMSAAELAEKRKGQMEEAESRVADAEASLAENIERTGDENDAEVSEAREYLAAAKLAALNARSAYEKAEEAAALETEAGAGTEEASPDSPAPALRPNSPLSDRLRRIGGYVGGAAGDPARAERVRQTRLLERIARATEAKSDTAATLG